MSLLAPEELEPMRRVGALAARLLLQVGELIRPGVTPLQINDAVHAATLQAGAASAPLGYHGFPRSVCVSPNSVVCHGIPGRTPLREGDIVNVDVTPVMPPRTGWHGDTSATFYVGEVGPDARHVVEVARTCLELGLAAVRPGARLGDLGAAIEEYARAQGCSVVRDYAGHGIGRVFHDDPTVEHWGRRGRGLVLRPGMAFTIEPMINLGGPAVKHLADGWTAVTADGSLSAQFEHTVLVTEQGCEVLTRRDALLRGSEDRPWVRPGPLSGFVPPPAPR